MEQSAPENIIYQLIVYGITEEQHVMEDIPHEYAVVKQAGIAPGLMVWGRYKNRWYPNPNCRYLISHFLREKDIV